MNQKLTTIFILIFILIIGCKKEAIKYQPLASLNVTTAVIGGGNVKLNSNVRDSVKSYNAKWFTVNAGETLVKLFPTNDPSVAYFNDIIQTEVRGIYSVFIAGQQSSIEVVKVKENLPLPYKDSTFGVRIINLSPDSKPININLASDTKNYIFFGVSYKQITDFLELPLPKVIPTGSVTFQIRDAASNGLLATYTLPSTVNSTYPNISINTTRFKNLTLVIKGLQSLSSGGDAFNVFPVANY